jgi:hypothetical protein
MAQSRWRAVSGAWRRSALGGWRSAAGDRRLAIGGARPGDRRRSSWRSALGARPGDRRSGARRSALGARRSALGARRSAQTCQALDSANDRAGPGRAAPGGAGVGPNSSGAGLLAYPTDPSPFRGFAHIRQTQARFLHRGGGVYTLYKTRAPHARRHARSAYACLRA